VRAELLAQLQDRSARLIQAEARLLTQSRSTLAGLARALPRPLDLLALARQRFDGCAERLPRVLTESMGRRAPTPTRAAARPRTVLMEMERHETRRQELARRAEACARRQVTLGGQRLSVLRPAAGLSTNLDRHAAALRAVRGRLRPASLQIEIFRLWGRLADN